MYLLNAVRNWFDTILFLLCLCLAITMKYFLFRLGLNTPVFPLIEMVLIYEYNNSKTLADWQFFIIGLALDIFSGYVVGTNVIALLLANAVIRRILSLKLHMQGFIYHLWLFSIYLMLIFVIKLILVWYQEGYYFLYTDLIMQYVLTLAVYLVNLWLSNSRR